MGHSIVALVANHGANNVNVKSRMLGALGESFGVVAFVG